MVDVVASADKRRNFILCFVLDLRVETVLKRLFSVESIRHSSSRVPDPGTERESWELIPDDDRTVVRPTRWSKQFCSLHLPGGAVCYLVSDFEPRRSISTASLSLLDL